MTNKLLFLMFIVLNLSVVSAQVKKDTLVNQTDKSGKKQGVWKKVYPNGNLAYEVFFVNDKPVGNYKRYHENGKLSAFLIYDKNGEYASAKMYDENGNLNGEGKYFGKVKDSTWCYYNEKKLLVLTEDYSKGKKHGQTKCFYPSGKVSEEIKWENGLQNGVWRQYYETGEKKIEAKCLNGQRNGLYYVYFVGGQIQIKGQYKDDLKEGEWLFYDENGNVKSKINYSKGIAPNQEDLDKKDQEELIKMDKIKGKLLDPNDFKNRPEEFIRPRN